MHDIRSAFSSLQSMFINKPYLIRCQLFVPNKKIVDFHFCRFATLTTNPYFFVLKTYCRTTPKRMASYTSISEYPQNVVPMPCESKMNPSARININLVPLVDQLGAYLHLHNIVRCYVFDSVSNVSKCVLITAENDIALASHVLVQPQPHRERDPIWTAVRQMEAGVNIAHPIAKICIPGERQGLAFDARRGYNITCTCNHTSECAGNSSIKYFVHRETDIRDTWNNIKTIFASHIIQWYIQVLFQF